tara:strand:- start:207 stop:377 length:171 start_codon:yes stop_codon:yes gene_type:complete
MKKKKIDLAQAQAGRQIGPRVGVGRSRLNGALGNQMLIALQLRARLDVGFVNGQQQ